MIILQGAAPTCSSSISAGTSLLITNSKIPSSHPFGTRLYPSPLPSKLHLNTLHCTATQELAVVVETAKSESEFVEIGYLSSVHGLQGEIYVKPSTDFPELRFSKPGRRWLRQQIYGKDVIQEVELVEGRGHHGQKKSWILSFGGVDTVDQAKQLVGSTLLVREDDRPELEEGEFYTRDLVGMKVILKETGECVGSVVKIFDSGAGDLLQVMLNPTGDMPEGADKLMPAEGVSGPLVWVPFVEAIVPDVDMAKREMWITPPKGLLELNIRSDDRSKKERRQLEWKERKKFQRRLIAAKKKLCDMEQKHVFDGLRYGEKSQRSLLADEIVSVNSNLLQQALQNIEIPSKRWKLSELINATRTNLIKNSLKLSKKSLIPYASKEESTSSLTLQEKGRSLLSKGKVGIVLMMNDIEKKGISNRSDIVGSESSEDSTFSWLQKILSGDQTFLKMEDRTLVPLVLVCPTQELQSLQKLFSDYEYFGFDTTKVWFLEEEKLPVVSSTNEEQSTHKILMKSPWEILQAPVGSGSIISLLSAHDIPQNLNEMGVEYFEVCSANENYLLGNAPLVGFVESCKAEIGTVVCEEETKDSEERFHMIISTNTMKLLTQQMDKLQSHTMLKPSSHVKLIDKEWTDIIPSSPNSYQFCSSIYSVLNVCPLDKICVMEITDQ